MLDIFNNYIKMTILSSILYLIFGLLLFFNPEGVIVSISIVIGVLGIIFGTFELILYYKTHSHAALVSGLFALIAGIVLVTNTNILATIIPMLMGIALILQGVKKLEIAALFKEQNSSNWTYMFIAAALTLICGLILFINPILGAIIAIKYIGLLVSIYAVISIADSFIFKDKIKQVNKVIDEIK